MKLLEENKVGIYIYISVKMLLRGVTFGVKLIGVNGSQLYIYMGNANTHPLKK
jgi:hypothetical protein